MREGQKVSAHSSGFIVMNLAVVQLHVAAHDIDSSALSSKEGNITERSSNGVMEEGSGKVHRASKYLALHKRETYIGNVSETSSNGVMDEGSGKIQEASAHGVSFIVMDVAIVESHVAAADEETPALQNKEGSRKGQGKVIQWGDG